MGPLKSPFRCPKVLFGPFRWHKSFSVFSRTRQQQPLGHVDTSQPTGRKAYRIDVFQSGKFHSIEKRYSEFEELHKQLKKLITTPEFPPKKVLKWQSKVLESRRVILEAYLQGVLEGETIPRSFFKFLELNLPRSGSFDSLDRGIAEPSSTHQPMVGFCKDAYLQENYRSILPDIVVVGVQEGMYVDQNDDYIFR